MWTQQAAISLCRDIEAICPKFGCHVALTGGNLYKDGERKDADILFYRIRQVNAIDIKGLFDALETIGVKKTSGWGWCHKAKFGDLKIDFFFPEEPDGVGDYTGPGPELRDPDSLRDMKMDLKLDDVFGS